MIENTINEILLREGAQKIARDDLLTKSNLDSFGYIVLFLELDKIYECFKHEDIIDIDFETLTMLDIIHRAEENGRQRL